MFREFVNHNLVERFKRRFVGTRLAQPLWEKLNKLSLRGMNIGNSGAITGSGELWLLENLFGGSADNAPRIVFDVGANVGEYALEALARCRKIELYCFEPSAEAFQSLSEKLQRFERVRLFNFGFGDREERVSLFSDVKGSHIASVYQRRLDHLGITMSQREEILLQTIDEFCTREFIGRIDLLKLDVEGHELSVLRGAEKLIRANRIDFIQFEFAETQIDSRTFFQDFYYFLRPNYRICRVLKDGLVPVDVYQERFEIFLYSNYLAVSEKIYEFFVQTLH